MRPGRTQTFMNLDGYEIFAAVYMKLGRNARSLVLGCNDTFCLKNIWADRKAYRLEISGPGLRFVFIYMRPVREFLVSVQQLR